jgi:hypothetical protein
MTVSSAARRAKADEIQALHDKYDSWDKVQKLHYQSVPRGTLCTIAKSRGAKIPKKHWRALGLLGGRRERTQAEETIIAMSMMARQGLRNWKRRKR